MSIVLVLVLALEMVGCHLFYSFEIPSQDNDLGPVSSTDSSRPADLAAEPDHASAPDAVVNPDLPGPDVADPKDLGLTPPCSVGSPVFVFDPTMNTCQHSSQLTQCEAHKACNKAGGWHVCTAQEYQARGGKTKMPGHGSGWLASCIRSGGTKPHAPTNTICGVCSASTQVPAEVAWQCGSGSPFVRSEGFIGVCTRTACRRVGVNQAAYEAYWTYAQTNYWSFPYVVCCK